MSDIDMQLLAKFNKLHGFSEDHIHGIATNNGRMFDAFCEGYKAAQEAARKEEA